MTGPRPLAWALSRDSPTRRCENVAQDNNSAHRCNRSQHRVDGIGRDRASPRQLCQSGDLQYGFWQQQLSGVRWPLLQHRLSAVRSSLQDRTGRLVTSEVEWVEPLRNPSSAFANLMGFAEPVIGPATSGRTRWLYPLLRASAVIPDAGAAVHLVRAGYDAEGADGFCRGEGRLGLRFPDAVRRRQRVNALLVQRSARETHFA